MRTLIFLSVISVLFSVCLNAQPGSLDQAFGNNGTVMSPISSFVEHGYALAVQDDGKILVAGFRDQAGAQDFAVARYNADGSLDDSFGSGGMATIDAGTDVDAAWCMALQNDGKIVLGGSVFKQQTTYDDYAVVRLNSDGTTDNSFGTNGIVTTDIEGLYDNAYEILVQDDGKIILGGDGYILDRRHVCLVRYHTDGTVDESFGFLGVAYLAVGTVEDKTKDIAFQSDGKIIAVGFMNDGMDDQAFVARFNTDGTVDTFFGLNGYTTIDIGGREDRLWTVCVDDDDEILVGGYTRDETEMDNDYLFMKYTSDGVLDTDFGSNGIKMFHYGSNDQVIDMVLQDDGKIVSIGSAFSFELLRLNENGDLDNSFGDNGKVNTSVGTYCHGNRISLYADKRVVVAGQAEDGGLKHFALARYHLEEEGGIDETTVISDIKMFPNPTQGSELQIAYSLLSEAVLRIELLNISGQLMYILADNIHRSAGKHHENLKLPGNLASGVYLLRISTANNSRILKFEKR
jgi:uncharacterized delta-60 repeat protein